MPDAPQRIAMDTSQKLPIRFGETLKKYVARGLDMDNLVLIPLTLAGYARYLKGIRDDGTPFEPSPDPLVEELMAVVAPLEVGKPDQDWSCLKKLFSRKDIFAVDLYEVGLGERIEGMVRELYDHYGAVRETLHKYAVVETIKYGGPDRDEQIEVYKQSLRNLSAEGIHCICYNFMPVLDWARTDLFHANPNGSTNLYFNYAEFAYFDIYILKRPGAREEWAKFRFPALRQAQGPAFGEGRNVLAEADELAKTMTPEKDHKLVETIVISKDAL